ncbi:MAG: hypothetical protein AAF638_10605 [Pseudomonadota bacterium]
MDPTLTAGIATGQVGLAQQTTSATAATNTDGGLTPEAQAEYETAMANTIFSLTFSLIMAETGNG